MSQRQLDKDQIKEMFEVWKQENPEPDTELDYKNDFTLLVAVVLSAQATDKGVNKATKDLFKVAGTPAEMVKLGEEELRKYINSIGLYKNKAKNVINLSQQLLDEHGGQVPKSQDKLEALPGVGRKTANVVRNTLYDALTIAVDTHVFRVANRTGLAPGKTPRDVEDKLMKKVPDTYLKDAHHWLILHGRYTCVARKPKCPECPVSHICLYKDKTTS